MKAPCVMLVHFWYRCLMDVSISFLNVKSDPGTKFLLSAKLGHIWREIMSCWVLYLLLLKWAHTNSPPLIFFNICSISRNSMYTLLQPRLDALLFEIVFPLMCFNDNDQKLWDEDPHEYVRKGYGKLFCCVNMESIFQQIVPGFLSYSF